MVPAECPASVLLAGAVMLPCHIVFIDYLRQLTTPVPAHLADAPSLSLLQGGAYLTLLNTIANMGVTLPKLAIFAVMDLLSDRTCVGAMDKVKGGPFQLLPFMSIRMFFGRQLCCDGPAVGPHLCRRHGQGEREALAVPFIRSCRSFV